MKRLLATALAASLFPNAVALADSCTARPTLTDPAVCNIPTSGGTCNFGSSDGIVDFPDSAAVTGQVTINGGANVWIGGDIDSGGSIGGYIQQTAPSGSSGYRTAIGINSPTGTGTFYVEGLHVDVNGNCDAYGLRNANDTQNTMKWVNNVVEGMSYNVIDGNCHGDLVQLQDESAGGGYALTFENFLGVSDDGQGFFIPARMSGTTTATLNNVYLRNGSNPTNTWALLWFWREQAGDPAYDVSLTDVWVDYSLSGAQLYPDTGTNTGDANTGSYSWGAAEPTITGSVNQWITGGTSEATLDYRANVGLNYDRTYFCGAAAGPDYTNNSIADETNLTATDIPVGPTDQAEFLFDGFTDDDAGHVAGRGDSNTFYVEFDLGEVYDMTNARIYADSDGGWVTTAWTMQVKDNPGDAWTDVFVDQTANTNAWYDEVISTSGRYVKITVTGSGGKVQANELDITGTVATPPATVPPVASYTVDCSSSPSCDFTDTTTAGSGTVDTWAWDFGDGNTSSSQNPTHDFGVEGEYTVCLTATDDTPLSDDYCTTVSIDFSDETDPSVTWSIGPFVTGMQTIAPTITDDSSIWRMRFKVNGAVDCTDTTSPFSCTWTPPSNNTQYRLAVEVTDVAGNETTVAYSVWASASTVTDASGGTDTTPPDVSFVSPRKETTIGEPYCIQVTAFDANEIWKVRVSIDGGQFGAYAESDLPHSVCFTPGERRHYVLRAQAIDTAGNSTVTAPFKVRAH